MACLYFINFRPLEPHPSPCVDVVVKRVHLHWIYREFLGMLDPPPGVHNIMVKSVFLRYYFFQFLENTELCENSRKEKSGKNKFSVIFEGVKLQEISEKCA